MWASLARLGRVCGASVTRRARRGAQLCELEEAAKVAQDVLASDSNMMEAYTVRATCLHRLNMTPKVSGLPCNIRREGGQSLVIGGPSLVIFEGKECNPL